MTSVLSCGWGMVFGWQGFQRKKVRGRNENLAMCSMSTRSKLLECIKLNDNQIWIKKTVYKISPESKSLENKWSLVQQDVRILSASAKGCLDVNQILPQRLAGQVQTSPLRWHVLLIYITWRCLFNRLVDFHHPEVHLLTPRPNSSQG